jgi:hypothetical protein
MLGARMTVQRGQRMRFSLGIASPALPVAARAVMARTVPLALHRQLALQVANLFVLLFDAAHCDREETVCAHLFLSAWRLRFAAFVAALPSRLILLPSASQR